ncbi:MAG: ABC transporter ATP-binding protein [Deltaproteobacteria bacterium]|nr:ABC transporter ATP-binding protein [Deltaproteobacteria bacterium]
MKRIEAVRNVAFDVGKSEIFGLLGPNGAGKTTTLKIMMSLIRPTRGSIHMFGLKVPDRSIYHRAGFLPENPYFYEYLDPLEFLSFAGSLFGIERKVRMKRAGELLERVGLADARRHPLRKFSKGMLQRLGIAQALINEPELLVLDEPMSGLDPIGRRDVRNLILELRDAGTTILFSSHILSDVEMICDRVAIINKGKVTTVGLLADLLRPEVRRTVIEAEGIGDEDLGSLERLCQKVLRAGSMVQLEIEGDTQVDEVIGRLRDFGGRVVSVVPHRETLEDIFVRDALQSD